MSTAFVPLNIAILTISDSRTPTTDTSGAYLKAAATEAQHQVVDSRIVPDELTLLVTTFRELAAQDKLLLEID